jgi:pyruvate dehydrogenase E2 component (dihydrolipoamide acetyltransferase)
MPDVVVEFSKRRKAIARRLSESKRTIPHFYVSRDLDMTAASEWRREFNEASGLHITITDLVIKAVAISLGDFPRLNSHVHEDAVTLISERNIGVAVSVDDGVLVPVVRKADEMGLKELSEVARSNAAEAQRGIMKGALGTFTVTSLGMLGVKQFLPIINPPECAILAVGAAELRAVPSDQGIAVRTMMTVTLACDHRAVDGAEAARFLGAIGSVLEGVPQTIDKWL